MINKITIIVLLFQIKLDLGGDHKWLLTFKKSREETNITRILMENTAAKRACKKEKKTNIKVLQPPDATTDLWEL